MIVLLTLFVCAAAPQASERDLVVVQIGGFDTHSDLGDDLAEKFAIINTALTSFVNEMKHVFRRRGRVLFHCNNGGGPCSRRLRHGYG